MGKHNLPAAGGEAAFPLPTNRRSVPGEGRVRALRREGAMPSAPISLTYRRHGGEVAKGNVDGLTPIRARISVLSPLPSLKAGRKLEDDLMPILFHKQAFLFDPTT